MHYDVHFHGASEAQSEPLAQGHTVSDEKTRI